MRLNHLRNRIERVLNMENLKLTSEQEEEELLVTSTEGTDDVE
jgi:hypothetical protein